MAQGGFIDFKALQSELRLPSFEGDVNALIDTFCLEVLQGSPISFETFKSVWKAQSFSFIHQATPAPMVPQEFMQLLYSTALNRLDTGSPFAQHIQHHLCLDAASEEGALPQQHQKQPLVADLLLQGPQDTYGHSPQQQQQVEQQQQQQHDPFPSSDHLPLGITPHARDELMMLRDFLDDLEDGWEGLGGGDNTQGGAGSAAGPPAADATGGGGAATAAADPAGVAAQGSPHVAGPAAAAAASGPAADGGGDNVRGISCGSGGPPFPTPTEPIVLWPPGHPLSTYPTPPPPASSSPHPDSQDIISAEPPLTQGPLQIDSHGRGTAQSPHKISVQQHAQESVPTSKASQHLQGNAHHLCEQHHPCQGNGSLQQDPCSRHAVKHISLCSHQADNHGPLHRHHMGHPDLGNGSPHKEPCSHCPESQHPRPSHEQSGIQHSPHPPHSLSRNNGNIEDPPFPHSPHRHSSSHLHKWHPGSICTQHGSQQDQQQPVLSPKQNGTCSIHLQDGSRMEHQHPSTEHTQNGSLPDHEQPVLSPEQNGTCSIHLQNDTHMEHQHPGPQHTQNGSLPDHEQPVPHFLQNGSHMEHQHSGPQDTQNGSLLGHQQPAHPLTQNGICSIHMANGSHVQHRHPGPPGTQAGSQQDHDLPNQCHTHDGGSKDHQQPVPLLMQNGCHIDCQLPACPHTQSSSQQDRHHQTSQQPFLHGPLPPQQHDSTSSPTHQLALLPRDNFAAHPLDDEMALALVPDGSIEPGAVDGGHGGAGSALPGQPLLLPWPAPSCSQLFWLAQRAAVLYFLYCLWQTQLLAPRVSVYLPLELLQLMVDSVVPELANSSVLDAVQAFHVMWRSHAYLVGALRRPPHGTYKFKEPRHKIGKDSRSVAASASAVMQCQPLRDALLHVRSTLPALTDLGAVDKLARQYNSARTRIFQPRGCLQNHARQHSAQQQQQQHMLHPPSGMFSDTYAAELHEEVERQAAEVWASLHPQAPSGSTQPKKKSTKGKKAKAGQGRGRCGRGRGALLLGAGLQRDHYEFEKDPLLDSDFEGGLAGGTDPGSLLGRSAISEEEGKAQDSEDDRPPPQVSGVFGALLRREFEQKKLHRQQEKEAGLGQPKQTKRKPKAPAQAAVSATGKKQGGNPRGLGAAGGAGGEKGGAGADGSGAAAAAEAAAARAAEEAVMRETAQGLRLVASDDKLRQELQEAGLKPALEAVLGPQGAEEEEEEDEVETAGVLPGVPKGKAAELLRRGRAREEQAVACAGRWLKAHATLMHLDDMPPDAQAGDEADTLLAAAGLHSRVPGRSRSPKPQEATDPHAPAKADRGHQRPAEKHARGGQHSSVPGSSRSSKPQEVSRPQAPLSTLQSPAPCAHTADPHGPDPTLAAALEHEDWETTETEDKEQRAPASKLGGKQDGSQGKTGNGLAASLEHEDWEGEVQGEEQCAPRSKLGASKRGGSKARGAAAAERATPFERGASAGRGRGGQGKGRGMGGGRGAQGGSCRSEGKEPGGRSLPQKGAAGRGLGQNSDVGHKEVQPQQRSHAPPRLTLAERKAAAAAMVSRRAQEEINESAAGGTSDRRAEAMEGVEAQPHSLSPPMMSSPPANGVDPLFQERQQQQQQQQERVQVQPPRSKRRRPSADANSGEQLERGEPTDTKKQRRPPLGSAAAAAAATAAAATADHSAIPTAHAAHITTVPCGPRAQPVSFPGAIAAPHNVRSMQDNGENAELPSPSFSSPEHLPSQHSQPQHPQPQHAQLPAQHAQPRHPQPQHAQLPTQGAQPPQVTASLATTSAMPSSQQTDLPKDSEDADVGGGDEDTSSDDIDLASLLPSDLARLRAQQEQLSGPGAHLGPMELDDSDSDEEGRRLVQESHALFALLARQRR